MEGTHGYECQPSALGAGRHNDSALPALLLIAFASVMCLGGLGAGPPLSDHEAINAQAARQTVQSGEWLIPRLGEIPRIRKTPLGIWAAAGVSRLVDSPSEVPVSELSARLPSAVAGLINVLLVWWLAGMMYGRRAGLVGGFISAACVATFFYSHNAQVDMLLTMLTTLTFACFWRGVVHRKAGGGFVLAFWAALALAMMAKAPLPLAIVGLSLGAYWLFAVPVAAVVDRGASGAGGVARAVALEFWRQLKRLPRRWFLPGAIVFVVLAGAWPYYVYRNVPNALHLWQDEYVDRYSGDMSDESQPFLYYVPILFGLTAPFLLSLPEGVAAAFLRRYRPQREGLVYALAWAIVGTLFLSSASFKRPHYVLSVVPAYCLLLTPVIDGLFFGAVSIAAKGVQWTCRILPVGLGTAFVVGGVVLHSEYPSLVHPYVLVSCGAFAVWILGAWFYARGRRTASFALVNMGMVFAPLLVWPVAGRHINPNAEGQALVRALLAHGVPRDAPIYRVAGRPDASIDFYSGFEIQRLINEIEMTALRENRRSLSAGLFREFTRRIKEKLAQPERVYLIMSAGHYGMLQREAEIPNRELFKLEGFHEEPGDDLVVITQIDNDHARSQEASGHETE